MARVYILHTIVAHFHFPCCIGRTSSRVE